VSQIMVRRGSLIVCSHVQVSGATQKIEFSITVILDAWLRRSLLHYYHHTPSRRRMPRHVEY
jgi:hypothetical protein